MILAYRGDRSLFERNKPPIPKFTICYYCKVYYADSWDHVIPYSYGGTEHPNNLIPSCRNCNSILGDNLFYTAREKELFIKIIIHKKLGRKAAMQAVQAWRERGTPLDDLVEWIRAHIKMVRTEAKTAIDEARTLQDQSTRSKGSRVSLLEQPRIAHLIAPLPELQFSCKCRHPCYTLRYGIRILHTVGNK